ncbi:hypothetical protein Taro_035216, partial [Colocasia esculenta]|nr:hypothetical protein [Colocasia esculenta]
TYWVAINYFHLFPPRQQPSPSLLTPPTTIPSLPFYPASCHLPVPTIAAVCSHHRRPWGLRSPSFPAIELVACFYLPLIDTGIWFCNITIRKNQNSWTSLLNYHQEVSILMQASSSAILPSGSIKQLDKSAQLPSGSQHSGTSSTAQTQGQNLKMPIDKSWMSLLRNTREFEKGLDEFLDFAFARSAIRDKSLCPCQRCLNSVRHVRNEVKLHVFRHGIDPRYTFWDYHGESSDTSDGDMSDVEGTSQEGNESATWAMLQDMMTAQGLANAHVGEDSSSDPPPILEQPNLEAKKNFKLVENAQIKLYPGCKDKANRSKQLISHVTGRKSFKQTSWTERNEEGEEPPTHELWRLTHQKKDGSWGSEYSRQVYETVRDKLEESSSQSCSLAAPTPEEVLTSIVGQRSGHIRGRGYGPRPTPKSIVTAATITGLQVQVKNKDEEISQMKEMISKQCEDMAMIQEKLENQREELTTHLENMMNQRFMDMISQF